jgi:CRP/FNR family transcriptional regulator
MPLQSIPIKVSLANLKATCSSCSLHELCLPMGLGAEDTARLDSLLDGRRQRLRRGEYLYRAGDPFQSLYAIRNGFFKIVESNAEGEEKIIGFYMLGELMGMDAISTDQHQYHAVALEDSTVCEVPFNELEKLASRLPALQHHFHRLMSREIMEEERHMLMLGGMKAEQRLAAFLLGLSQRFAKRGYSPSHFYLRMTREEIGNYLGLTLETVSRLFSKFQKDCLISVQHKDIEIKDPAALKKLRG